MKCWDQALIGVFAGTFGGLPVGTTVASHLSAGKPSPESILLILLVAMAAGIGVAGAAYRRCLHGRRNPWQ